MFFFIFMISDRLMKIEIPMPDRNSRKQIFDKKLIQEGVELDVDIEHYVNQTSDWNASKITNFLEVSEMT